MTTARGGAREGAGRPPREEPKSYPIWVGQISEDDRQFIISTLEPQERFAALMEAAREREMNEYFQCRNCEQVVQGWHASQQIECCERPSYHRIPGPNRDAQVSYLQDLASNLVFSSDDPSTSAQDRVDYYCEEFADELPEWFDDHDKSLLVRFMAD